MEPLITLLICIAAGVALCLLAQQTGHFYPIVCRVFLVGAPVITLLGIILSFASFLWAKSIDAGLIKVLTLLMSVLKKGINGILGYCLGYLFHELLRHRDIRQISEGLSLVIRGLSIQTGMIFMSATLGKLFNMSFMIQFFTSSGYTVSFLYFIMTAEALCGLILLFNIQPWLKYTALSLLTAIMTGAIVTHVRNHDPLDDSSAAIVLGFELILLAGLYILSRKLIKRIPASD